MAETANAVGFLENLVDDIEHPQQLQGRHSVKHWFPA
jgi:hypothetical protein